MSLPLPARLYLAAMALAAAGLQVLTTHTWSGAWGGDTALSQTHLIALFAALAALGVLAQHFPLEAGGGRKIDVAAAVYFASILLLGVPAGMALVGLVQLLGQAALCLRRNPLSGKPRCTPTAVVFNTAQFMLAAGLSGLAYFAWLPHSAPAPLGRVENLWAIPTAAAAMYLVNSWAVAIMIGLQRGASPLAVWLKGRGADLLQFGALFALGLCMALLASHYPWALLLFVAPGVFVHASLRRSLRLLASEAAARAEADRAVASRDQFISIAAHELKNPLACLLGYTQLLLRDPKDGRSRSPEEIRETLQVIGQQGQKLDRLIGTLLDSKRAEVGKLSLERSPTDVAKLVHDAVATARIGERDQPFIVRAPSSIVAEVDPLRLEQVLGNLLDNALKYNRSGEPIEVEVASAPPPVGSDGAPRGRAWLRLAVRDHGAGIPPEDRERVFESFYQSHGEGYLAGLGLGLYVVRSIVEAHGGRIRAESPPDGGTRFVVELPVAQEAQSRAFSPEPPAAARRLPLQSVS